MAIAQMAQGKTKLSSDAHTTSEAACRLPGKVTGLQPRIFGQTAPFREGREDLSTACSGYIHAKSCKRGCGQDDLGRRECSCSCFVENDVGSHIWPRESCFEVLLLRQKTIRRGDFDNDTSPPYHTPTAPYLPLEPASALPFALQHHCWTPTLVSYSPKMRVSVVLVTLALVAAASAQPQAQSGRGLDASKAEAFSKQEIAAGAATTKNAGNQFEAGVDATAQVTADDVKRIADAINTGIQNGATPFEHAASSSSKRAADDPSVKDFVDKEIVSDAESVKHAGNFFEDSADAKAQHGADAVKQGANRVNYAVQQSADRVNFAVDQSANQAEKAASSKRGSVDYAALKDFSDEEIAAGAASVKNAGNQFEAGTDATAQVTADDVKRIANAINKGIQNGATPFEKAASSHRRGMRRHVRRTTAPSSFASLQQAAAQLLDGNIDFNSKEAEVEAALQSLLKILNPSE